MPSKTKITMLVSGVGIICFILGFFFAFLIYIYRTPISRFVSLDVPGRIVYDVEGKTLHLKLLEEDKGALILERAGERLNIGSSSSEINGGLTVSPSGNFVYWVSSDLESRPLTKTILRLKIPNDDEELHKYKPVAVISKNELSTKLRVANAWPDRIVAVAADDSRLLLDISFVARRRPGGNQHRMTNPYYLLLADNSLKKIEP